MNFQCFKYSRSNGLLMASTQFPNHTGGEHMEGQGRQKLGEPSKAWSEYRVCSELLLIFYNYFKSQYLILLSLFVMTLSLRRPTEDCDISAKFESLSFLCLLISTLKCLHRLLSETAKHMCNCDIPWRWMKTHCACLSVANPLRFIPYSRCFPYMPFTFKTDKEAEGEKNPHQRKSFLTDRERILISWSYAHHVTGWSKNKLNLQKSVE